MKVNAISTASPQYQLKKRNNIYLRNVQVPEQSEKSMPAFKGSKHAWKLAGIYGLVGGILGGLIIPPVAIAFALLAAWSGFAIGAKMDDSKDWGDQL